MKILFITWETYPVKSATSNCIMAVIHELQKNSIDADILNITGDDSLPKETMYGSIKIYSVFVGQYANVKMLLKKKKVLAFKVVLGRILERLYNHNSNNPLQNRTIHTVLKKLEMIGDGYDAFVAACSHVINGFVCNSYCTRNGKKFILYQVDPIGTNIAYKNLEVMKSLELQIYKNAKYIITTPILTKEKEEDPQYMGLREKIFSCEFPNIRNLTVRSDIPFKKTPITCFYSGRFYNGVRDCRFTLEVLRTIYDTGFQLVFAGDGQEEIISEYRNKYFGDRLIHLGMISLSDSFNMMQKADILINIGNNVTNQVPSKLFDYFSTGKPIINFCKSKDCPTIPYIDKYGLGINIIEGEDSIERQALKVMQFIMDNYMKRIEFDEIKKKFQENTPEYVSRMFLHLLEESITA